MLDIQGKLALKKLKPGLTEAARHAFLATFIDAGISTQEQLQLVEDTAASFADAFADEASDIIGDVIEKYVKSMQINVILPGTQGELITAAGPVTGALTMTTSNGGIK